MKDKPIYASFTLTQEIKDKIQKIIKKETIFRSRTHFIDFAIEKLIKEYEGK